MGAPNIPIEFISRVYSNVCTFAELWPELEWDGVLNDLAEFVKRRREDEKGVRIHFPSESEK
jgi:hypothetical protein